MCKNPKPKIMKTKRPETQNQSPNMANEFRQKACIAGFTEAEIAQLIVDYKIKGKETVE